MKGTLFITGDPAADELLNTEPLALLLGMLLDQQVPMEWAFLGPSLLRERLGGALHAGAIAAMDLDEFLVVCKGPRAIHRFWGSMGKRVHEVCRYVVDEYDGDAARIWEGVETGGELYRRLRALPGYGDEKARIFIAILAKRVGVRPAGWEVAAGAFADDVPRSVADIDSPDSLARVRDWKKAQKAAKRAKSEASAI